MIVGIVVVFVLVVLALRAVVIVPVGSTYVVERMGRYVGTLQPGFNVIMPILDRIAFKHPLAVQTQELSDHYETKDRRQVSLTSTFRYRVLDVQRASYGAADYLSSLRELMRTGQRRYIQDKTWDALREDTRSLEGDVMTYTDTAADALGVKVLEYQVKDLQPS
jgi:regulator of protease activity HflC (stomatin/prohibitin superfamily)